MNEAQAQTVETIEAVTKTASWYTGEVGVVAGTWAIVAVGFLVLLVLLYRRLEKRDIEIAELKTACAKEIAQAKIDAEKEAEERVQLAWNRITEIFGSVNTLFAKCDASNAKVSEAIGKLTTILATKGVFARE